MEQEIDRIQFLGLPADGIENEKALKFIESYLDDVAGHQLIYLTLQKLLKARRDPELARCIKLAKLVLPVSKGIIRGAAFQRKATLNRYNPFEFTIRLLTLIERLGRSVYLLGSRMEDLEKVESNLKISFPKLRIVGRYSGYFDNTMEKSIILAIRKASPALLLVGKGVPDQDKWIARNMKDFNPGIYLWINNCFEIFSGREKNISKKIFNAGLETLSETFGRPWKVFRIFPYLYFKLLVLVYRIRGL